MGTLSTSRRDRRYMAVHISVAMNDVTETNRNQWVAPMYAGDAHAIHIMPRPSCTSLMIPGMVLKYDTFTRMPARGFGWPGSVFTVGTCRGLLLALLLEPSIVTTVSDIMLRRSARSGSPHAPHRTRSRPSRAACTLRPGVKGETGSKHPGGAKWRSEPNRYGGRADRGTPVVCVHHGPRARRPLPLRTTYGINSGAAILPLLLPRYGRYSQCRINLDEIL